MVGPLHCAYSAATTASAAATSFYPHAASLRCPKRLSVSYLSHPPSLHASLRFIDTLTPGTRPSRMAFTAFGLGVGVGDAYRVSAAAFDSEKFSKPC